MRMSSVRQAIDVDVSVDRNLQSQPTRNHLAIATRQELSTVRYMEMLRNGYAMPSFAADSAAMICLSFSGTCFLAYLPPNPSEHFVRAGWLVGHGRKLRTDDSGTDDRVCGCETCCDG